VVECTHFSSPKEQYFIHMKHGTASLLQKLWWYRDYKLRTTTVQWIFSRYYLLN
jgi:hypothetical protein